MLEMIKKEIVINLLKEHCKKANKPLEGKVLLYFIDDNNSIRPEYYDINRMPNITDEKGSIKGVDKEKRVFHIKYSNGKEYWTTMDKHGNFIYITDCNNHESLHIPGKGKIVHVNKMDECGRNIFAFSNVNGKIEDYLYVD